MKWFKTADKPPKQGQSVLVIIRRPDKSFLIMDDTFYGWMMKDGKWMFAGDCEVIYWTPITLPKELEND